MWFWFRSLVSTFGVDFWITFLVFDFGCGLVLILGFGFGFRVQRRVWILVASLDRIPVRI